MISMRTVAPVAALASVLVLGGCTTDGYGHGGVNVGYGSGYYYDHYPYGPYAPYGWYDGYYYPGNGYWLYDRRGTRHRWSERQKRYWEQRRGHGDRWHGPATRPWRPEMRDERRHIQREPRWDGDRDRVTRPENGRSRERPQRIPRDN